MTKTLAGALEARFGERIGHDEDCRTLERMAQRGSCRSFLDKPVDPVTIRLLCAVALCSPTKSDLQQRDILIIEDTAIRAEIARLAGGGWIASSPNLLIFCGNNRRQRMLHEWRGHAFANDHFDAAFNAAVDAGIALSAFVLAAEATGLGCCPISAVRNEAQAVSDLLHLPDHVFPVAGLALGHPADAEPVASMRLPLDTTLHTDRYDETGLEHAVERYDSERATRQPYRTQRYTERFGVSQDYGWSEDKARQYAEPERADFGAFIRRKGFDLT